MSLYTADGYAYEGMNEETVTALRLELGKTTTFVDKETYDAYVVAHQG